MRKVKISYRRFFRKHSVTRLVPEKLAEMNSTHMLAIIRLYLGMLDDKEFITEFFGLPKYAVKHMKVYLRYKLIEMVDFTRDEDGFISHFIIKSIPGIKKSHAPKENLKDMDFEKFMLVDTHFSAYAAYNKPESLNGFITALYTNNDDEYYQVIANQPEELKMAIYFNWVFIHRWLARRFPLVFPEAFGDAEKGKPQVVQWLPVFDSFVGDDVAHIYEYKKLMIMDVLRIMNNRIKEYNKRLLKK